MCCSEIESRVLVLLEWDGADKAAEFAGSLELHEAIEWAGAGVTTPRTVLLDQIGDMEAWGDPGR